MAVDYALALSYEDAITKAPALKSQIWAKTAIQSANRRNIFSKMDGPDKSGKAVLINNDFSKGDGATINFTTVAPLGGTPRRGSQRQLGAEEVAKFGSFSLTLEITRHAIATDENFKTKIAKAANVEGLKSVLLGDHAGYVQENDLMMLIRQGNPLTIRPGNASNRDALRSGDVVTPSLIRQAGVLGELNGCKAVQEVIDTVTGMAFMSLQFVSPKEALTDFKETSEYNQAVQYAAERGKANPIFTGQYPLWDGHRIIEHVAENTDANGPLGSTLLPKAGLGVSIAAGTASVTITGGSASAYNIIGADYFRFFSNYDYQWSEDQAAETFTANRYVMIYNLQDSSSGAGDAGKWGFYRYVTNTGNTLVTTAFDATANVKGGRLSGTGNVGGSDTRHTQVGGITWNASYNTEAHAAGSSLVIETNYVAVAIAFSFLMGAESVIRGYGKDAIKETGQKQDYDYVEGFGYQMCYGQSLFYDTDGNVKRVVLCEHAVNHPGVTPQGVPAS